MPIDMLNPNARKCLNVAMQNDFRQAFMWHLDNEPGTFADIVRATGVSRDVLNKLKAREDSSTTVENGILIAAYYGKTINQFIHREAATPSSRMAAMLDLLEPQERQLFEAQLRGVLSARVSQEL